MLRAGVAKKIARGEFPYWSADGESLVYAEIVDREHEARAIWQASLRTGMTECIWDRKTKPLGLVWDSIRDRLYVFDWNGVLRDIDLRKRTEASPFPSPHPSSL